MEYLNRYNWIWETMSEETIEKKGFIKTCGACDEVIIEGEDYFKCFWCEHEYHEHCTESRETPAGTICLECLEDQKANV